MKSKTHLIVILIVLTLLGLVGWTASGQRRKVSQDMWEYRIVYTNDPEKILNELGAQGWELVTVQPIQDEYKGCSGAYYLKRAK